MEKEKSKKDNMFKKVLNTTWQIMWWIVLWVIWLFICFIFMYGYIVENWHKKATTTEISFEQKDWWYAYEWFESSYKSSYKQYTLKLVDDWENSNKNNIVRISSKDYEWIEYFYYVKNYLYLNLEFEDWFITKWSIIDKKTKEDLWSLSFWEASEMYSFTEKYETKEIEAKDIYNLSEFEENTVYRVFIGMNEDFLTSINNDLDYDVVVHLKWFSRNSYDVFKPYIYLKRKKDKWWPKKEKGFCEERSFIFQKATKEDVQLILEI